MKAELIWIALLDAREHGMTAVELTALVGGTASGVYEILTQRDPEKKRYATLPGCGFWIKCIQVDGSSFRPAVSEETVDLIFTLDTQQSAWALRAAGARGLDSKEWSFVSNAEPTGETDADGKPILVKPTPESLDAKAPNLIKAGRIKVVDGRYVLILQQQPKPTVTPAPVKPTIKPTVAMSAREALADDDYLSVIPRSPENAATDRSIRAALAKLGIKRTIVAVRVRLDRHVLEGRVQMLGEKWSRTNPRRYYRGKAPSCTHCLQHCPPQSGPQENAS